MNCAVISSVPLSFGCWRSPLLISPFLLPLAGVGVGGECGECRRHTGQIEDCWGWWRGAGRGRRCRPHLMSTPPWGGLSPWSQMNPGTHQAGSEPPLMWWDAQSLMWTGIPCCRDTSNKAKSAPRGSEHIPPPLCRYRKFSSNPRDGPSINIAPEGSKERERGEHTQTFAFVHLNPFVIHLL